MNADDVVAAAAGVSVVVHAANPPGYRNWKGLPLPMLESTIAAAKAAGARIVLPGNGLQLRRRRAPARRRVRASASEDAQGRDSRRDGGAAEGRRSIRCPGAHRPRGRLLRQHRSEQLVQSGHRQAGSTPSLRDLSGQARRRTRLGVSTRPRRDHRAPSRARGRPSAIRRLSLRRPLVRSRCRHRRCRASRRGSARGAHPAVSVVRDLPARAFRRDVPRAARDALPLDHAPPASTTASSSPSWVGSPTRPSTRRFARRSRASASPARRTATEWAHRRRSVRRMTA